MSKFLDESVELPPTPPPSKDKEKAFTRKAASAREHPESDEKPTKETKPPRKPRKKKEITLAQVSIKLHPDVIKAIGKLAAKQRKMPAEIMRDLILKGITAEGIEL